MSERVGSITVPGGAPLANPVQYARDQNDIIVSAPNCKFCRVTPSSMQNGTVAATLITNAYSPTRLGESGPGTVLVVENATGDLFRSVETATGTTVLATKINTGGSGLSCATRILAVAGTLTVGAGGSGEYALKVFAECNDGSGDQPTYLTTSGNFDTAPPNTSTANSHTVVARAQIGASRADLTNSGGPLFAAGLNLYRVGNTQNFVLDTSLYEICTLAGTRAKGTPPL